MNDDDRAAVDRAEHIVRSAYDYERARARILRRWPTFVLRHVAWVASDDGVRAAYAELQRRRAPGFVS